MLSAYFQNVFKIRLSRWEREKRRRDYVTCQRFPLIFSDLFIVARGEKIAIASHVRFRRIFRRLRNLIWDVCWKIRIFQMSRTRGDIARDGFFVRYELNMFYMWKNMILI